MATPKKSGKSGVSKKDASSQSEVEQRRFWLMYPQKVIKRPVMWELAQKFRVITNIRQASVTDEIGIVSLEVEGDRSEIKAAISWLQRIGVSVEPVEINVIES